MSDSSTVSVALDHCLIPAPTEEQLQLAAAWHGGQGSMLYAVSSTGGLFLGTRRPLTYDYDTDYFPKGDPDYGWRPATDTEWADSLIDQLLLELKDLERSAELAEETTDAATAYVWRDEIDEHWAAFLAASS
jgi:hypothetical protein